MAAAVILVGCGKMGGALLAGWLERGADPESIAVVEPAAETRAEVSARHGVPVLAGAEAVDPGINPDVVLFAVKPQLMDRVVPAYRPLVGGRTVFLSIAAGRTIASIEAILGDEAAVVRAMPNTPAAVGRAITAACANRRVSPAQRSLCGRLLAAVGEVVWVEDETLLDAVTAVSGSGPAYVFLLVEELTAAGIAAGLPDELAARLARATVIGAAALLASSDEPAEVLRRNVTSPGGTTEAALQVLTADGGLRRLLSEAVQAAARRSKDLSRAR